MANIASSKKDARRSAQRALRNRSVKSAVKTKVTKFRRGGTEGQEDVEQLAAVAISALDRAAAKGVLHPNNTARRKARLMKRLNGLVAAAAPVEEPAAKPAGRGRKAAAAPPAASRRTTGKK